MKRVQIIYDNVDDIEYVDSIAIMMLKQNAESYADTIKLIYDANLQNEDYDYTKQIYFIFDLFNFTYKYVIYMSPDDYLFYDVNMSDELELYILHSNLNEAEGRYILNITGEIIERYR